MKFLILVLIYLFPILLYAQDESSFGVVIEDIDSTIAENVEVIYFDNYNGYIFPKEYGDSYFRKEKKCLDLDTSLIKIVDKELVNQYLSANKRFMEIRFQEMFDMKETRPDAYDWKALKKDEKNYWKSFRKNRQVWIDKVKYSDRQYLGYINSEGEKIILIQLVDFREDPHSLKRFVDKQFISGWHGWFYSNISRMHYHVDSGKLTVNEEF